MTLHLYNTMTRKKERFEPVVPGRVGIYVCGPTVYSDPHLGHARGPIIFDVLRNWLTASGYTVRYVSNITDVGHLVDDQDDGEDKLVQRARLEKLEPMEVAERYFWAYFDAITRLGVKKPDIVPRASGHIVEQIELAEELIRRGFAYERNGSVYFDVSAWDEYGVLSGRDPEELLEGTRVVTREEKDDPRDFALWKRAEDGHIMRWNSPWGEGYPGWHIECSVMATKYLGEEFDIHGGGLDLIFPHHECEIAQARAAGMPFARTWMHWNMITLGGEKMAKSKNHFIPLTELFAQTDPSVVRFHLLRSHYRSVSDFSETSLHSSEQGLKRLREAVHRAEDAAAGATPSTAFDAYHTKFASALNDDLNTPEAIAALFDATRDVHALLADKHADTSDIAAGAHFIRFGLDEILGVGIETHSVGEEELLSGVLEMLIEVRNEARRDRNFALSDTLRDRLGDLGIRIEDGPDGTHWIKD